jgi:periplasmic divalent cation tolerance protein
VTNILQVSTATPTREAALALAESAVSARLAANAQIIGPVASAFWHAGEFGTGEEWKLLLATTYERYDQLEEHLVAQHPWENPEVTAVEVVRAPARYAEWARAATAIG